MLKSLLIVINDEYLSKGITLALIENFKSIHTTKNPFEAIEICKNEIIDIVISNVNFSTIKPEEYLSSISNYANKSKSIIIIKDAPFKIEDYNSTADMVIKEKSVSIKDIKEIINSINKQILKTKRSKN